MMHPRSTTHPIPEGEVAVFVLASPFYQLRFNYYTQSPFYQLRTITTPSLPFTSCVLLLHPVSLAHLRRVRVAAVRRRLEAELFGPYRNPYETLIEC